MLKSMLFSFSIMLSVTGSVVMLLFLAVLCTDALAWIDRVRVEASKTRIWNAEKRFQRIGSSESEKNSQSVRTLFLLWVDSVSGGLNYNGRLSQSF